MELQMRLPNQYVEIEQEEMMYLDGGDFNTFKNNMFGAFNAVSGAIGNVSKALKYAGWTWGKLYSTVMQAATYGYWWACATFGSTAVKMGLIIAGTIGGIIAGSGTIFAVWYLYNNRVFY